MKRNVVKTLSVEAWKLLLKNYVHIFPDGSYRLDGSFGHSSTFGFLKFNGKLVSKEEIQAIADSDGTIKESYISYLAKFMKNRRSLDKDLAIPEDHVLVVIGLMKLISEVMSE